jgi:formylglycine-generating enzyme required for sulfatase activity
MARSLLKEIAQRRRTPEGFVFVPAGRVPVNGSIEIAVGPFYFMRTEVSNREFLEYMEKNPGTACPFGWTDGKPPAGSLNHPVTGISRGEAAAYAFWRGERDKVKVRLPSEAEWQWAASGDQGPYPWGKDEALVGKANIGSGKPVAVDSHTPDTSPFGALHMAGNVSEWTNAVVGVGGVVKGGAWADPDRRGARTAFRVVWNSPAGRLPHVGFRLLAETQ